MNEIKEWLGSHGDFESGLLLFAKYSRSRPKLTYLQRKRDMAKLRYELEKLAGVTSGSTTSSAKPEMSITLATAKEPGHQADEGVAQSLQKPNERLRIISQGTIGFENLPEPLQIEYKQICDNYRLMRSAHEKMKAATSDVARSGLLAEIIKLEELNKQGWQVIDLWATTGELPAVAALSTELPQGPTPKELNAARACLTRNLQLLQNCTDQAKREVLIDKLRVSASQVAAAGCGFGKNAETLQSLGLIEAQGQ